MSKTKGIQIALLGLLSVCLFSCGDEGTSPWIKERDVVLAEGDFHTVKQTAYIQSGYNTISHFADGTQELSKPRALEFRYEEKDAKYIQVSFDSPIDGGISQIYEIDGSGSFGYINAFLDTNYYWRVSSTEDFTDSKIYTLKTTSSCPRNIDLDGITNVRDMGGYVSSFGGKIKQGLVYRGGRLTCNSASEPTSHLTEDGYKTMTEVLGLKSEIDLRYDKPFEGEEEPENAHMSDSFFETVRYYPCPIDWHSDNLMLTAQESIRETFEVFGNPNNYPVYFHCSIGTDRTGLIAYLLGALLGMNDVDLYRDYLFSNFGNIGSNRTDWAPRHVYYESLQEYEGKNLSEKCKSYLRCIGVSTDCLNSVISELIER